MYCTGMDERLFTDLKPKLRPEALLEDEALEDGGVCDLRHPKIHRLVEQLIH